MKALENRIPPPLVAVLVAAAMWGLARVTQGLAFEDGARLVVAALMLVAGAAVCLAGVLYFRLAKTTVNPLKPETASALVTGGIYQVSRNPMYLGFAFMLAAWAVYLGSAWALLGVPVFVLYMNRFQIRPEERALVKVFGEEFTQYQARVRRWI